jgi:hypothetical protein
LSVLAAVSIRRQIRSIVGSAATVVEAISFATKAYANVHGD